MAYDDSEALQPNSTYSLGGYTFELKVQNVHEPGEPDVVSVFAICRSPDGTRETVPMDFPEGTTVESWTVEANETEASVYAKIKSSSLIDQDIPTMEVGASEQGIGKGAIVGTIPRGQGVTNAYVAPTADGVFSGFEHYNSIFASSEFCNIGESVQNVPGTGAGSSRNADEFTFAGKTVYYRSIPDSTRNFNRVVRNGGIAPISDLPSGYNTAHIAWTMLYGATSKNESEELIARFAIDIREADGGPDGDWDEPGSDGPFSDQIYVEVTGASAGIHSVSNIPQEAPEQLTYGSGGIGGNGGGGGAGASTVIIYDFVSHRTSIDGPAENAIIREPGIGGPGGKGGKGGDGCILIFY